MIALTSLQLIAKMTLAGKIKKQKPIPGIIEEEIPFKIPKSWRWTYLPEIYNSITPAEKIKTSEILESGDFPVVDQGQRYVAGYTESGNLTKITKPVVVFGDHTREVKLINFNFIAGADGVKILEPILVDSEYFYLLIKVFSPETRGYGRHFKLLNQRLVPLAPLNEQERIVEKTSQLLNFVDQLESKLPKPNSKRGRPTS